MEWLLNIVLVGLLVAVLFHAVRLHRSIGTLRHDRAALEGLVAGFADSTRQAQAGLDRLRGVADGAARQIVRQVDVGTALRDDLNLLIERGDRVADRLDNLIRAARPLLADAPRLREPDAIASDRGAAPPSGTSEPSVGAAPAAGLLAAASRMAAPRAGDTPGANRPAVDRPADRHGAAVAAMERLAASATGAGLADKRAIVAARPPQGLQDSAVAVGKSRSNAELGLLRALRLGQ